MIFHVIPDVVVPGSPALAWSLTGVAVALEDRDIKQLKKFTGGYVMHGVGHLLKASIPLLIVGVAAKFTGGAGTGPAAKAVSYLMSHSTHFFNTHYAGMIATGMESFKASAAGLTAALAYIGFGKRLSYHKGGKFQESKLQLLADKIGGGKSLSASEKLVKGEIERNRTEFSTFQGSLG